MKRTRLSVLLILISVLILSASSVSYAGSSPKRLETFGTTYWAGAPFWYTVLAKKLPDNAKLISIKSSNPKVLKAKQYGSGTHDSAVRPMKNGKSKITIKYRTGKKTISISDTLTVKKYPKAIKKIIYNGKPINLKKNKFEVERIAKSDNVVKVKVIPNKGWKVNDKIIVRVDGGKDHSFKNGDYTTINRELPRTRMWITLKNKKGEEFEYSIIVTK